MPQGNEITADCEIIDQLGIVTHGEGRDRSTCEARKIGRAAKLFEAIVIFKEGFERDGGGEIVFGDPRGGCFKDPCVHGIIKMLWCDDAGDFVVDIIVG